MLRAFLYFMLLAQGIPVQPQQSGTVTGTLRDSLGRPVPGIRMAAVARQDSDDEASGTAMAGIAETDVRGQFTLENIPPGRYYIAAGRLDQQTYYPGTQNPETATVVTIAPGATIAGIDFVLDNGSFGRAGNSAASRGILIPLVVTVEGNGKLPVMANGHRVSVRLGYAGASTAVGIDATSIVIPGPQTLDVRTTVENLPANFEVKSIQYGTQNVTDSRFRITPDNSYVPPQGLVVANPVLPQGGTPTERASAASIAERLSAEYRTRLSSAAAPAPSFSPPQILSITLTPVPVHLDGVRVSGRLGTHGKPAIAISGSPGTVFADETFEFLGVPQGIHVITAPGDRGGASPQAAIVAVGADDLSDVVPHEVLLLPDFDGDSQLPLPLGDHLPNSDIPLTKVHGIVTEELSGTAISEGTVVIRSGNSSYAIPLGEDGRFEIALLPGTYGFKVQTFGHSTGDTTFRVEDKDVEIEFKPRKLY